ncbi:MAG TPA: Glu-tRNA(Gln) amidotransferase subunit GatE [Candidatus Saccharimonadales bacterium]|nr:Glu-tRNA(Gln) amidotransferase subunit GatE [Candidatus Saccharimonadales bacterium]
MHDKEYYSKLGFKCGLEIHQRLATREKLFCRCSADQPNSQAIMSIERRQRAVAGELGAVDKSTEFESRKERRFTYHLYRKSTCLIDIDEEPPGDLNEEALETAMMISLSLGAKIPDEIEPMRKGIVDGSDPSSFQRTMLCGYDGRLEVDGKAIEIPSVFLEEESSGIIASSASEVVYSVERLGIPLIEIDTDPVIATPDEAKKVAMKIGLMLRVSGKVQRGIGSIRQDVNVSVRGGARVEIKGLQEIDSMDEMIDNEVQRQVRLIEIRKELVERGATVGEPVDLTEIFKHTEAKVISDQVWQGGSVMGVRLVGFKGLLGREINPKMRLGSEISDYAKMAEVKGIIHSDENLDSYKITARELEGVTKALAVREGDAFILIAEKKERCEKAMALAISRINLAMEGVPSETRGADSRNRTTRFLRPIPGGSRMYPETDALPIETAQVRKRIGSRKIDIDGIRKKLMREIGNRQLAEQMLWSKELQAYEEIVERSNADPMVVASVLLEKFRELSRAGLAVEAITEDALEYIFRKHAKRQITKLGIEEILKSLPKERWEVDRIIKEKSLERMREPELRKLVRQFAGKSKGEIMREIMSKHRLVVDGEELNGLLKGA